MSSVWKYFDRDGKDKARCRQCPKQLGCRGSSTSALLNHLRSVHKIDATTKTDHNVNEEAGGSVKPVENCAMLKYVSRKETIGEIFSRCVAEDGLSVSVLKKSGVVQAYLQSKQFKMPAYFL